MFNIRLNYEGRFVQFYSFLKLNILIVECLPRNNNKYVTIKITINFMRSSAEQNFFDNRISYVTLKWQFITFHVTVCL